MSYNRIFPYHWVIDDKEEHITSIRIYGIGENNDNICVRIENFTPWVYIELPPEKNWTALKAQKLGEKIDELIPSHKPLKKTFVMREKLYNANIRILEDGKIEKKLFPYLFCTFANRNDIKQLMYKMKKPIALVGVGLIKIKMHEQDADPILQLVSCKDIPTAGWIEFVGEEMTGVEKVTLCHKEYKVKWKNLKKYEENNSVGNPKIMGFDIEVNSTNVNAMPKAEKPGDKVFQISCVFRREGTTENDVYLLTLGEADSEIVGDNVNIYCYETEADLLEGFTELIRTENPNVIAGYNILGFDIPYMIERAKHNFCISSFDLMGFHKYKHAKEKTIVWSSSAYKNQEFSFLDVEGRLFVDLLPLIRRDFKFDNYKLSTVSDIFIGDNKKDLPPKGIFKCYREGIVRESDGTFGEKAIKAMSKCGAYCVQDSVLVIKLMDKLQTWVGLTEMACTFNTQIFTLYTQGQQIKVYSQVYKYCTFHNIVVEKDGYITKESDRYVGAHVFPPVPGVYDRVVPFDFASLYPTTIIAYNIDYSTIVFDESIPDSMCHVFIWRDDLGCIHDPKVIRKNELTEYINKETEYIKELRKQRDETKNKVYKVQIAEQITKRMEELKPYRDERSAITKTITKNPMCEQRYFRFLKEPKGVIPTILQNLLDMRKKTRKQIKNTKCKHPDCDRIAEYGIEKETYCLNHKQEKDIKILADKQIKDIIAFNGVLDKRQLAYKVSCNSMYGAYGVRKGYLPFMPGAMCVTFMGRTNIEIVANTIQEKHKGHLVYGDSVSGDTPILIRYPDSKIDIKTIESLNDMWMPYEEFKSEDSNRKEKQQSIVNLEVWTNGKWSKIKRVIRHKTKKRMFRINTHKGSIDVSEDHSLLNENSEKVKPTEVDIGYKLLHSFPNTEGLKNLELTQDEIQFKNKKMDRVSCVGKLQAQRLYCIMKSLGVENINISNEDNTYILSLVDKDYCKNFNEIKEIIELPPVDENTFIYDLETEEGKFHAGVGEIVVKNTDSNYIHFPHLKGATETWDYAEHVASEITKLFPRPIELEFESTIYFLFFILTKKRYMYLACDKEGNVESKVGKKGVLLNRRDSSLFVRDIYEAVIKKIFEKVTRDELLYFILEEINKLCSGYFDVKYFRVTKSVGSVDELNIVPFVGEKGEKKVKMGDYTIKALPTDVEERKKQLLKKEAVDAKDYYVKSLPAQVQLAEKMRRRGKRVDAGSRLEYLVIDNGINNDKQYNKIEDIDYFKDHSDVLKVDYMYYLKALVNPLDQVLNIYFNRDKKFKGDFILHQYDFRSKIRRKVLEDIRQLFIPKMVFK